MALSVLIMMVGWKCEGKRNTVKRKGIQKGRRKGNKERKKGNVATSLKNHSCAASKENVKGYCEGCRVENQPRNYTTHTQQAFSFAPACFTKRELEQKKDDGEREKERERIGGGKSCRYTARYVWNIHGTLYEFTPFVRVNRRWDGPVPRFNP